MAAATMCNKEQFSLQFHGDVTLALAVVKRKSFLREKYKVCEELRARWKQAEELLNQEEEPRQVGDFQSSKVLENLPRPFFPADIQIDHCISPTVCNFLAVDMELEEMASGLQCIKKAFLDAKYIVNDEERKAERKRKVEQLEGKRLFWLRNKIPRQVPDVKTPKALGKLPVAEGSCSKGLGSGIQVHGPETNLLPQDDVQTKCFDSGLEEASTLDSVYLEIEVSNNQAENPYVLLDESLFPADYPVFNFNPNWGNVQDLLVAPHFDLHLPNIHDDDGELLLGFAKDVTM